MEDQQYYRKVDVKERKPPIETNPEYPNWSINVIGVKGNGRILIVFYDFKGDKWLPDSRGNADDIIYWLEPITLTELLKEVADKAWEAAEEFRASVFSTAEITHYDLEVKTPNKEQYLNSIK